MRILGQTQQSHSAVHVGIVGSVVPFDVLHASSLLIPPLGGHAIEEAAVDRSVQLVDVHGLDTLSKPLGLCLKPLDRRGALTHLVAEALLQRSLHELEDLIVEAQLSEETREPLFKDLFTDIGLAAFSLKSGAVVVDVLLLFQLADHGAAAVTAGQHTGEGKVVAAAPHLGGAAIVQDVLNGEPQVLRNQGVM
ncbi:hypothetical protein ASD21_16135 [Caulobacter sp. Root1455]|nr:hypothetical protein ASD38_16395 [Caulobacter sp. Root487D2Y]KQY91833.1 hypothetical protein ASD21_16135 [Caulobacter sp. Root1455]